MEDEKKGSDYEFDPSQLADELHNNLKLSNKRTLFKSHKNCFVAKDAVDWM